jgi:hypothetical protein
MLATFKWMTTEDRYRPKLAPGGAHAETAPEYCARLKEVLPRFPPTVLTQWFYEHWDDIDRYAWLDYDRLDFQHAAWTTTAVISSGLLENQSVQVDRRHFEEGVRSPRIQRIAEHFESHGTWPVPPIFLANHRADIVRPDGFQLTSPYHLLEGHHRTALFLSLAATNLLRHEHEVWVAGIADA